MPRSTSIPAAAIAFALLLVSSAFTQSDVNHTTYSYDKTLHSNARIDPTTLAMQLSIPLPSYPGRGAGSVSNSLEYSSKVWSAGTPFHYTDVHGAEQTQITPTFAERSAGGWSA